MSESAVEVQGEQNQQQNDGGSNDSGFTPPATQEELNRIISDRVKRERARFADYEDLKGKAAKLAEIEASNLSETEKAAQRIAAAETEVAQVPVKVADALRTHLVSLHNISADDAELFLTANDPDLLLKQVARLTQREAERVAQSKKQGNHVSREGTHTTATESDERQAARALFGGH